ncbi:30S ribosomal protein S6 [Candidatus Saccharibacteria bacterium]|nr:30S ribosomal protein S6 [Candidatus Saccharibacteria bacterium]
MKEYELSVLFHPDLEMNIDPALDKVKKLIAANGGKIVKEEADGKKRLAYAIKGQEFAVYYFFVVSLPSEAPSKISSTLNITDEVLRYLLVCADARREEAAKAKKAEEAKEETKEEVKEEKGE